jgi:diaminopimelate epimerase
MLLTFYKYHGTGNDFIIIDNRTDFFSGDARLIARMCDRRFGIGADGLLLFGRAAGYDFNMTYYNADGSPATMCGNGGRCMAAFARLIEPEKQHFLFLAGDGPHQAQILNSEAGENTVRLSMRDVENPIQEKRDYLLNTGTPHFVRFLSNVNQEDFDLVSEGRSIRYHERFATEGINVDFVSPAPEGITVRTYERGVEDETLSCGTGVTASAIAWAAESGLNSGPIPVSTRGGILRVDFTRQGNRFTEVFLTGPAVLVYKGEINLSQV